MDAKQNGSLPRVELSKVTLYLLIFFLFAIILLDLEVNKKILEMRTISSFSRANNNISIISYTGDLFLIAKATLKC